MKEEDKVTPAAAVHGHQESNVVHVKKPAEHTAKAVVANLGAVAKPKAKAGGDKAKKVEKRTNGVTAYRY